MLFQVDCLSPFYFVILLEFHTFIWNLFLCHLILPNFLCLWSPFLRIQHCDSSWFSHPFVGEDDSGACAGFPVGGTGACPLLGEAGYCPSGGNTVSRHLFRDNYWLKTTLGSLSANGWVCVPTLLVIWLECPSIGAWRLSVWPVPDIKMVTSVGAQVNEQSLGHVPPVSLPPQWATVDPGFPRRSSKTHR